MSKPVPPDNVFSDLELTIFGVRGNSLKSFWALIFWFTVLTNENVWEPVFAGSDSNSSKSAIGMNDLDLYNLIWLLGDKTSTKYVPSSNPGKTVFSAV